MDKNYWKIKKSKKLTSENNEKEKLSILTLLEKGLFVLLVIFILYLPLVLVIAGYKNKALSGVEEKALFPKINIDTLKEDKFSDDMDKYLMQNIPGKDLAVNFRSDLLFHIFGISPHAGVAIGKDGMLFSEETINYYYNGLYDIDEKYLDSLMGKLEELNNICNESGKKLIITITPTKPRYYEEYVPEVNKILRRVNNDEKIVRPYDKFIKRLNNSNISVFDCVDYINKNMDKMDVENHPLWMKGSHHWTQYQGGHVGQALENFIIDATEHELPLYEILATKSNAPVYPDNDLLSLLNLKSNPTDLYDHITINFKTAITTYPNVLVRGGSFLGMLLLPCCTIGEDNIVYHIENKYYFTDHYMTHHDFENYDDIKDLKENLGKFDIIILEIHEMNVYNATFGFLDYLLENKNILSEKRIMTYTTEDENQEERQSTNEIVDINDKGSNEIKDIKEDE